MSLDEGLSVDSRSGADSGDDSKLSVVAADLLREDQLEMGIGIKSLEKKRLETSSCTHVRRNTQHSPSQCT